MRLNKLWIEAISNLPKDIQENLIREAPHTRVAENVPVEFKWLQPPEAFVDLGFENLDAEKSVKQAVFRAFSGTGVRIPGTAYKMRHDHSGYTTIERAVGDEVELPKNWKQAVLVTSNNTPTWIGKLVRIGDQINADVLKTGKYRELSDGWMRE